MIRGYLQVILYWRRRDSSVGRAVVSNQVTRVQNEGEALVPFGKALILIARSLGVDLKPSVLWLLTNKHLCFFSSQVK